MPDCVGMHESSVSEEQAEAKTQEVEIVRAASRKN
jgi:hypothetical protein